MYRGGIESSFANSGGTADEAELPDMNPDQADTSEPQTSSSETRQASDTKLTLVHFKKADGRYEGRFLRHKEKGEGRHRLEGGELTFDEVMAQYDDKINQLKLELAEIIKEKEQAIADISPKSEPERWVEDKWASIQRDQAQQEQEDREVKEPVVDQDATDKIPVVSQQSEDEKMSAADNDKLGIPVSSTWQGSDFHTTLPPLAERQYVPQTNLKGRESLPDGPGGQPTGRVDQPKPMPSRLGVDKNKDKKQIKALERREWVKRNKNRIIGGIAIAAAAAGIGLGVWAASHHDNDHPENGTHSPAAPTEQAPGFADDGIVTQDEMKDRYVSQVLPYGQMQEYAGDAMSSGDMGVVYQWNGTYFYKVTPKAMHSFGLRGDSTSTPNVMKVLAAHSDGEIKVAP